MAWVNPPTRATGYKVTASNWNDVVGDLLFLAEIGYAEYTANVASVATTAATATQVVSLGAITYTADPILVEFFCPRLTCPSAGVGAIELCDGATPLGSIGTFIAGSWAGPVLCQREFTPSAAAHTYNVRLWTAAGTITAGAGVGGGGVLVPGFIRARYVPR